MMINQDIAKALNQHILELNTLARELVDYAESLVEKNGWSLQSDIRVRMFFQLQNLVGAYRDAVYFTGQFMCDDEWLTARMRTKSVESRSEATKVFETMTRNGFFFSMTSIVEAAIRSVVRGVSNRLATEVITEEAKFMFKWLEDPKAREFHTMLKVLTTMRNSIHNNGFYLSSTYPKLAFEYRKEEYQFENWKQVKKANRGRMITYANWIFEFFRFLAENEKLHSFDLIQDVSALVHSENGTKQAE